MLSGNLLTPYGELFNCSLVKPSWCHICIYFLCLSLQQKFTKKQEVLLEWNRTHKTLAHKLCFVHFFSHTHTLATPVYADSFTMHIPVILFQKHFVVCFYDCNVAFKSVLNMCEKKGRHTEVFLTQFQNVLKEIVCGNALKCVKCKCKYEVCMSF